MKEKVFVVSTDGRACGEAFSEVLGVFRERKDAELCMQNDIKSIKTDWDCIDFDDPQEWVETVGPGSYDGYGVFKDYSYSVSILEFEVQ